GGGRPDVRPRPLRPRTPRRQRPRPDARPARPLRPAGDRAHGLRHGGGRESQPGGRIRRPPREADHLRPAREGDRAVLRLPGWPRAGEKGVSACYPEREGNRISRNRVRTIGRSAAVAVGLLLLLASHPALLLAEEHATIVWKGESHPVGTM